MILSRRRLLAAVPGLALGLAAPRNSHAADASPLMIYGPPATPSVPLAHAVESGALDGFGQRVGFRAYRDPDELRAGFASGQWRVAGTPTYAAANLYNRGLPVRLLNVLTGGLLYGMSRETPLTRIEDLGGKTVVVPFRNDMPDLVFRVLARKRGLNPDKDMTLHYATTPTEAAQLLLAGKADAGILSEPAATVAVMQGRQAGVAIHRGIDLQALWREVMGGSGRLPQAGLAVAADLDPALAAALHRGCARGVEWTRNNPSSAARLGADYLGIRAPMLEAAIPASNLEAVTAKAARADLERLFTVLHELSPAILGGKLPDDRFYMDVTET